MEFGRNMIWALAELHLLEGPVRAKARDIHPVVTPPCKAELMIRVRGRTMIIKFLVNSTFQRGRSYNLATGWNSTLTARLARTMILPLPLTPPFKATLGQPISWVLELTPPFKAELEADDNSGFSPDWSICRIKSTSITENLTTIGCFKEVIDASISTYADLILKSLQCVGANT